MSKALGKNLVPLLAVVLIAVPVSVSLADVADPQLMTDHPVYRGELSCSTLERTIEDARRVFSERYGHAPRTETEKLVAGKDFPRTGSDSVLIRFGKGKILASEVFATHETRNDSILTVTYGWTEGGEAKEARHAIRAGAEAASWVVPTGRDVATKWVRMEAE